jgi:hypothetical protein
MALIHTNFWLQSLAEGDYLGDPGIEGRIMILKEEVCKDVDCIEVVQGRVQWQALVNMFLLQ